MEVEDDSFFADLTKRISLLIMDEDDNADNSPACYPSVSQQSLSHPMIQPFAYESTTCRRECKGTGVFIPRSSTPRRMTEPQRFASFNTDKFHRQPDKSTREASNMIDFNKT
ncbi:hypothetical protein CKAN_02405500 [Cinnamomum micranthum f. kanehirae]|uniref:Uncharacterized protein n=1 Tax=Cinnamomum micranthum f. kanehirae TaxID=337451 RepID=A0A443PVD6_9MAGN|nr:hypothetical protein CKAN_02405500 [Cinnamomum micranthum f. kanehirae]